MLDEGEGTVAEDGADEGGARPRLEPAPAALPAVEEASDPDGDEGQVVNALLPGMSGEAALAAPGGEDAAADLMARKSRLDKSGEGAVVASAAPASPGGEMAADAQRGAARAGDDGAARFSLLEGAQATVAATLQTPDSTASQQLPAQAALQSPPLQGPQGDKSAAAMNLHTPLQQHAQWSEEMGQQVKWLVTQKMQSAEMKLNPAHLGAVEVRVTVQNDQVNLHFSTPHVQVKDSLEDSLPRLREIFQESGLNLADVDVSQQDTPRHQAAEEEPPAHADSRAARQAGEGGEHEPAAVAMRRGVVDFYA